MMLYICYTPNDFSFAYMYTKLYTVTHSEALPPPPFSSAYQRGKRKGKHFY